MPDVTDASDASTTDPVTSWTEYSALDVCDAPPPAMDKYGYITLALSLFAVFGNLLVIVVVLKSKKLRRPPNYFVVNLSITDGIYAAFILPMNSYSMIAANWGLPSGLCTVVGYGSYLVLGISVMSLGCMALNRYVAIVWPTRYTTIGAERVSGGMVVLTYVLSILVLLPALVGV